MTDNKGKLRALFLSALMVFSVFAGTVALSGSAAAAVSANSPSELSVSDPVFQGEELTINEGINGSVDADDLIQLRRGILGDEDSDQVVIGTVGDDPTFTGDQMDVEAGYYFLRANGQNLKNTQFRIVEQDLSASADDTVYGGDNADESASETDLEITSENFFDQYRNGEEFAVSVNSTSINGTQLNSLFDAENNTDVTGTEASDESVDLTIDNTDVDFGDEFTMDFDAPSDLDYGTYNFTIESQTSSASETVSIEYTEASDTDASITSTMDGVRGDYAQFTVELVNTESATVEIGDLSDNYNATMTVTDASDDGDTDDGEVTVRMNTFNAGHDGETTFTAPDEGDDVELTEAGETQINDDFRLASDGYNIAVFLNGDQVDSAGLSIAERDPTMTNVGTWTAPSSAEIEGVEDVANATMADQVALGDHFIVQVEASGIFGYLTDDVTDNNLDGGEQGLSMSFTQENFEGTYSDAPTFNVSQFSDIYHDDENNQFFLVANSNNILTEEGASLADDEAYSVTFEINDSNPYVAEDETESATTEVTFVEENVEFGTVEGDYQVQNSADAEVRGTSSLAPGTELTIRAQGGDIPTFFRTVTTEVEEDGSWAAPFNFSERAVGEEFTISVEGQDAEVDGVFADTPEWETEESSEQLQQEVAELNTLLNETMDQLNATESMLDQKNTTIEDLETQVADQNATIEELRTQLEEAGGASQELLDEKNATIEELENLTDQLNQDLTQTEGELRDATGTISDLESEVTALNTTVNALRTQKADLQNQTESLQSTLEEKNSTVSNLQSTLDEKNSTIDEQQSTISNLQEEAETTTASGPGFTAVLALVALMGAALLAVRRQQ